MPILGPPPLWLPPAPAIIRPAEKKLLRGTFPLPIFSPVVAGGPPTFTATIGHISQDLTHTPGTLTASNPSAGGEHRGAFASGLRNSSLGFKFYWEADINDAALGTGNWWVGLATDDGTTYAGHWYADVLNHFRINDEQTIVGGSLTEIANATLSGGGDTWTGILADFDNGRIYARVANAWANSGNPIAGTGYIATIDADKSNWSPVASIFNNGADLTFNFGASAFNYDVTSSFLPSGTYSWNGDLLV